VEPGRLFALPPPGDQPQAHFAETLHCDQPETTPRLDGLKFPVEPTPADTPEGKIVIDAITTPSINKVKIGNLKDPNPLI